MNSKELAIPVAGVLVDGKTIKELQGECMLPQCCPFPQIELPELTMAVVNPAQFPLAPEPTQFSFSLPSSDHLRSSEVTCEEAETYWEDEYGNLFCSLNIKGNNFEDPCVYMTSIAPSGCMVYGLMDSDALLRVHRASMVMRGLGIDTEYDVRVIEPETLPYAEDSDSEGSFYTQQEFKKILLDNMIKGKKPKEKKLGYTLATVKDIPKVAKYLENTLFYFHLRSGQTAGRFSDLAHVKDLDDLKTRLAPAFRFVNEQQRRKDKKEKRRRNSASYYDLEKMDDIKQYLLLTLPARIAKNYARLHDGGLVHIYTHPGNQSDVGSIYDLDSIKGAPLGLGDAEVTAKEIAGDVITILDKVAYVTEGVNENTKIFQESASELFTLFNRSMLLRMYMQERQSAKGFLYLGGEIEQITSHFDYLGGTAVLSMHDFVSAYLNKTAQEVGIKYMYEDEGLDLFTKALGQKTIPKDTLLTNMGRMVRNGRENALAIVLMPILEENMRHKHAAQLKKIVKEFGGNVTNTFIRLSCLREAYEIVTSLERDVQISLAVDALDILNNSMMNIIDDISKDLEVRNQKNIKNS